MVQAAVCRVSGIWSKPNVHGSLKMHRQIVTLHLDYYFSLMRTLCVGIALSHLFPSIFAVPSSKVAAKATSCGKCKLRNKRLKCVEGSERPMGISNLHFAVCEQVNIEQSVEFYMMRFRHSVVFFAHREEISDTDPDCGLCNVYSFVCSCEIQNFWNFETFLFH